MTCPNCTKDTKKLIAPGHKDASDGMLYCPACYTGAKRSSFNHQLHDVVFDDGTTRLTKGKAWEIDHRVKSPDDGRTIINRVTNKPAQY